MLKHEVSVAREKSREDLPCDIIRLIQSFLDDRYAVRSTLLSKSWLRAFSTSPNVVFHQDWLLSSTRRLAELMDRTLVRYLRDNIPVDKLHIYVSYGKLLSNYEDDNLDQQVHRWLKFAYESRRVFDEPPPFPPPLRILKLYHVRIVDERDIYVLLSECLLLEEIILYECRGVGRVVVTADFDRLRLFEIKCLGGDVLVEIFTPTLRSFSYGGDCNGKLTGTLYMYEPLVLERARVINIDECRFLRDLSFDFLKIEDWCLDDMSRFMFLERLAFDHCDLPKRTVIASLSLKKLKLLGCSYSLEEVDVRCDTLSELSISWRDCRDRISRWPNGIGDFVLRCSASPKIQFIVVDDLVDSEDISNLLKFVKSLTSFRLEMNFCCTRRLLREQEDDQLVDNRSMYGLPFTNVEAIRLGDIRDHPPRCLDFLFLTFRPNYIFSRWKSRSNNNFIRVLLLELMDRTKKCGCSAGRLHGGNLHKVGCWRHLLKDRRVAVCLSSDDDDDDGIWEPLEPESRWRQVVEESLGLRGAHDIRFTLTWHAFDEEAGQE